MADRDTLNADTRCAAVARPSCRTSIPTVRSLEVSAGARVYLPSLFPEAPAACAGSELQQDSRKAVFQQGLKAVAAHSCSWVCLWNQNSVVFSSPRFAARCLFLSLQRFPAPLLHLPCGGELHPRKGTLMSGSEALLLLESEQGCRFSSPIGVG